MIGTPEGTRTPDPLLRRQLLYPPELQARMERVMGIGNRTHATSLEGWDSTIELHPQVKGDAPNISLCIIAQNVWGVKPFLQKINQRGASQKAQQSTPPFFFTNGGR